MLRWNPKRPLPARTSVCAWSVEPTVNSLPSAWSACSSSSTELCLIDGLARQVLITARALSCITAGVDTVGVRSGAGCRGRDALPTGRQRRAKADTHHRDAQPFSRRAPMCFRGFAKKAKPTCSQDWQPPSVVPPVIEVSHPRETVSEVDINCGNAVRRVFDVIASNLRRAVFAETARSGLRTRPGSTRGARFPLRPTTRRHDGGTAAEAATPQRLARCHAGVHPA